MTIPKRFTRMVDMHLLGNLLNIERYPLILAIVGTPGMGKTYQLRTYLKGLGINIVSISAANLESKNAGEPAQLLQQKYLEASAYIQKGEVTILLIDDIDTTLGEWENNTGTVNHQNILAFLMHIADSPTYIDDFGKVNRVPIFFTGNNFDLLYAPLVRDGRAVRFDWEPTRDEKISIISSIFSFENVNLSEKILDLYPNEKISFFSDLKEKMVMERLLEFSQTINMHNLLTSDEYKLSVHNKYCNIRDNMPWEDIINEISYLEAR